MNTRNISLFILGLLAGCTSRSPQPDLPSDRTEQVRFDGTKEADVVWKENRPVEFHAPDGQVVPFRNGEAIFGNQIALVLPNESTGPRVTVFRQPQAINLLLDHFPYIYLKEGTQTVIETDGFKGEPYADPADRTLCWTARTCGNPDCASKTRNQGERPYLFAKIVPRVRLRADGRIDWSAADPALIEASPECPICKRYEFVKVYVPEQVAAQQQALAAELGIVRAARDRAAAKSAP